METQKKPQAIQSKPPTPVADASLTEEVRRLEGYTMLLHTELQKLNTAIETSTASRARDVAKGVFFGTLALGLLFVLFPILMRVFIPA